MGAGVVRLSKGRALLSPIPTRRLNKPSIVVPNAVSLTPRFSGVQEARAGRNRFSGFRFSAQTAEAVLKVPNREITPLKRGVYDRAGLSGPYNHEFGRLANSPWASCSSGFRRLASLVYYEFYF